MQFTKFYYNISNFIYLNGHKLASLHCIKHLKRYSNRFLYTDPIGGTRFLLRCIKAELYHGQSHRSPVNEIQDYRRDRERSDDRERSIPLA